MAGILIGATLEANEGEWEAIHDAREGCSNKGVVLRKNLGIDYYGRIHVAEVLRNWADNACRMQDWK